MMANETNIVLHISLDANEANVLLDMIAHCIGSHKDFAPSKAKRYSRTDDLSNPSLYQELMFDLFDKAVDSFEDALGISKRSS